MDSGLAASRRSGMTSPLQERQGYAKSGAMPTDATEPEPPGKAAAENEPADKRPLTPEAERALAEAAARRAEQAAQPPAAPKGAATEISGRGGLDPTRYGDWEINGLTSDF
jgi:hypothetical protein